MTEDPLVANWVLYTHIQGNGNFPPCHAHQDAPSNYASISLQLVLDGVVHLQSGGGSFEQGGTGYLETPHSLSVGSSVGENSPQDDDGSHTAGSDGQSRGIRIDT